MRPNLSRTVVLTGLLSSMACGGGAPVARTAAGGFAGRAQGDVLAFLGMRYGRAPVGPLRHAPPQPEPAFEGTRDANAYGATCPQLADPQEGSSTLPQSEDCLFLNVWTPDLDGQRPVIVFIHGGGWVNGGTADPWYDGSQLASRADVVVVSIDYRLGPLGFLDLSAFGAPFESSGNLGILDQQLALRWVHDHVAAFGGDPANVTLMGQSAGAMSVALHLALPSSRPLFHKAIAQSGALNLIHSSQTARQTAARFLELAGVADPEALRALSVEQLMAAEKKLEDETQFSDLLFGPVIDGVLIPEAPLHAIARGDAAGIPLLTGTTLDETRYWWFYFPWLETLDARTGAPFLPQLSDLFDRAGLESLIAGYERRHADATPGELTMTIATDAIFRMGQIRLAEAHAGHEPKTFMYRFDWRTQPEGGKYGAPHAVELPFLMRTLGAPSVDDFVGTSPPPGLSDAMIAAWSAFARTGNPASNGLPAWPAYEPGARSTMLLSADSRATTDPAADDRRAWDGIAFDSERPKL